MWRSKIWTWLPELFLQSLTAGRVLFGGTGGEVKDDANLAWDNTDKTLTVKGSTADGSTDLLALQDSGGGEVASVDSDGNAEFFGDIRYSSGLSNAKFLISADNGHLIFSVEDSPNSVSNQGLRFSDESGAQTLTLDGGKLGINKPSPDSELHVNGALTLSEKSADPSDPAEGSCVIWMSDGTGTGDDGDVLIKVTAGGSTKTATLVDFSEV